MDEAQKDTVDNFVSISLERSACDLCGLDTSEQLTSSCYLCHCKTSLEPVQMGFNQHPGLIHTGVVAHESCFAKSHQLLLELQQMRRRASSPGVHRRGITTPKDFGGGSRHRGVHHETIGDRLQWLVNLAKNEDVKNRHNRLEVHSSPCTRSNSPIIFRGLSVPEAGIVRGKSESNLSDTDFLELKKSYARYLYGSKLTSSQSDDNVGRKAGSYPSINARNKEQEEIRLSTPNIRVPLNVEHVQNITSLPLTKTKGIRSPESGTINEDNKSIDNKSGRYPSGVSKDAQETSQDDNQDKEKGDEETRTRQWCNKQSFAKEQLNKMSSAEIKKVVSRFEIIIKDISAKLVDLLQERDSLCQEVKFHNMTIQKLLKLKHKHQELPVVKTTCAGNI